MQRLIILPFLLFSMIVSGTNYYVRNGGNDSNTGLSDAQAWAHHPWMSTWTGTVTLARGDIVYMNKGDAWSFSSPTTNYMTVGQSGTAGNYITTTSYGTGARPIIKITTSTGYDVIYADGKSFLKFDGLHIQHWTSAYTGSGSNGIYLNGNTNPCHDIEITDCEIDNIPYGCIISNTNCYNITIGDITATTTATASSYSNHIHHYGYAAILLTGCNPTTDRSDWNVYHNYIHDGTRTTMGDNEYGISITCNSTSHAWPKYVYVRYNRVENNTTWGAISCHGGQYLYFQDNYVYNSYSGITVAGDTRMSFANLADHLYVERNIIEQPASQAGTSAGFIRQTVNGSEGGFVATNIYIRDNTCFYTTRPSTNVKFGIRAGQVNGITISGNSFYNGGTSSNVPTIYFDDANEEPNGNKNISITHNFIKKWGGIDLWGSYITGAVTIANNIIDQPVGSPCFNISNSALSSTAAITVYNNTFINDTYSYCFNSGYGLPSGGSFIAKNNIIGRTTSSALTYWRWAGTISGTFTCDYNLYWNSTSSSPFYIRGSSSTFAAWKGLGYDSHSPNVTANLDPTFSNAGGSYLLDTDFKLGAGSPAINAGTDVGLTTDYSSKAISGLPDIGAFESESSKGVPATPSYISSVIENASPSVIEMTYSLSLANIVPATSAFSVKVNTVARTITSVTVSGTKVLLTLASPVVYGNSVTVAYTKPSANPLQTSSGGQAATISAQTVANKVNAVSQPVVVVTPPAVVNTPPVVVVNNISGTYSGFVGTLNASGSYDANKDNLTYAWKVPDNIPVSATNKSIIEFLAPVLDINKTFNFTLTISDGKATQSKTVPVTIIPYEPDLEIAEIISIAASDYQAPYYPYNILDGNVGTMWSAVGDNQWIILELREPFKIQHVKTAFKQGQKKEFYFDILGSNDKENWEPVLTKTKSCAFSGDLQVFDFPASKAEKEFRYVKFVGQGNSVDSWNYISELKIFGYKHRNPSSYDEQPVKLYPNPAHELVNILIDEQSFVPDYIKIVSLTGKVIYEDKVDPEIREFQIPIDFKQGVYIVQMGTGDITLFTQKLIVNH